MNPQLTSAALPFFTWLALCAGAAAQNTPHIGYIHPAGGQRGTTVNATIGGQYLDGVSDAHVSGAGVTIEILKHRTPIRQNIFNELRQKRRELLGKQRKKEITQAQLAEQFRDFAKSKDQHELTLAGFEELDAIKRDPKRQPNAQLGETVEIAMTIAADAPLGNRELRLQTRRGLTSPLVLQVGQFPELCEAEPNDDATDTVLPADMPLVINGQIMPGDVDRFRFQARKGMRLVASVEARSLIPYLADAVPGWFQATLSLQNTEGVEGAYSDDHGFDPDPIIYLPIPTAGEYVLEIRDAIYRGREDFVYRITLGQAPLITSVFPMGCRMGQTCEVKLTGWNLKSTTTTVDATGLRPGVIPLSVERSRHESNMAPFEIGALPETVEAEPNNEPDQAQPVELPLTINGRTRTKGDVDRYLFRGKRGQQLVAEVRARRLGSPIDSLLKLTGPDGKLLAASDDFADPGAGLTTHQADSRIAFTLPADGKYQVTLSDAQGRGGQNYGYRLRLSQPMPDFALRVIPSSLVVQAGRNAPLTVFALRRDGFTGPIKLRLRGMPEGFSLNGAVIPAGADKTRVTMQTPLASTGKPVALQLEGGAVAGRRVLRHMAVPADDQMQAFLYRHLAPAQECLVLVRGKAKSRLALRFKTPTPVKLPVGGAAEVRVAMPQWMLKNLTLELDDPPPGVSLVRPWLLEDGMGFELTAAGKEVTPGERGNLIIRAFQERTSKGKDGQQRRRRNPVGFLPSLPYELTEAESKE